MKKIILFVSLCVVSISGHAHDHAAFHNGPVIQSFGKIAQVETDFKIPKDTRLNVVFDAGEQAKSGQINRTFDSAARFINMHVEAGVPLENIKVAIVVHGGASVDLTHNKYYQNRHNDQDNANIKAISSLLNNNTRIVLCGQTAAYRDITKDDLVPGVEVALSAMTAHALLLQQGYTANPF